MSENKSIQEEIYIGVDCHKETHYLVAINLRNQQLLSFQFTNTKKGLKSCISKLNKLKKKANLHIGLEGAYGLGKHLAKFLIKAGFDVYEINSALTKSRRSRTSGWSKSDPGDALIVAKIIRDDIKQLPKVIFNNENEAIGKITKLRQDFVLVRTENLNKLHARLLEFDPEYKQIGGKDISAKKTMNFWLEYCDQHYDKEKDIYIKSVMLCIKTLIHAIQNCDQNIYDLEKQMDDYETADTKRLQTITGIGRIAAFTVMDCIGDISRFSNAAKLASYAGRAPITYSSGTSSFTRANRRGDRRFNAILDRVAFTAYQYDELSAMYFQKKIDEGKTKRQARKYLSRRLINIIYAILRDKVDYNPQHKPLNKKIKEFKATWAKCQKDNIQKRKNANSHKKELT
jgi:transposase